MPAVGGRHDHAGSRPNGVSGSSPSAGKRTNYSREDFIAQVWEWKPESGGQSPSNSAAGSQLRLGNERSRWTRAFRRGDQGVRRPPQQGRLTATSGWSIGSGLRPPSRPRVETREVQGNSGICVPAGGWSGTISVATTRPETMLADMAVAVNPVTALHQLIGQR